MNANVLWHELSTEHIQFKCVCESCVVYGSRSNPSLSAQSGIISEKTRSAAASASALTSFQLFVNLFYLIFANYSQTAHTMQWLLFMKITIKGKTTKRNTNKYGS